MYTMFAGRGFNTKPQFITRIEDRNGNVILQVTPQHKEVISEVTAYTMAKMMGGAIKFGTAKDFNSYGIKAETGCKTGTTNDNSDAWFICYTPQLLCGTWVGCDDRWIRFNNTGVGQGGKAALPNCGTFMKAIYNDPKMDFDQEAVFIKPAVDRENVVYDYVQGINAMSRPEAQADDLGNGEVSDYGDMSGDESSSGTEPDTASKQRTAVDESLFGDEEAKKEQPKKDTGKNKTAPKAVMPDNKKKPAEKKPTNDY